MNFFRSMPVRIRRIIYATLARLDRLFGRGPAPVVIYCFHSIAPDTWRFSHDQLFFEQAIEQLLKTRRPVTLEAVALHMAGTAPITEPSFAICFDDGYQDILSVRAFLNEHGIRPAVFVLTQPEAADGDELGTKRAFLDAAELWSLRSDGWDIGSHSATHRDFAALDLVAAEREIIESKLRLEAMLGEPVRYFAYPKGRYTEAVIRAVERAGYTHAFSMDDGPVDRTTPRYAVPRIGVDRTHTLEEFAQLATPSAITFRAAVKRSIRACAAIFPSLASSRMPHPLRASIQDRLTTLRSRLMRLIEPRLLTYRLYATVPSERAALPLPALSQETAVDGYYAGRFFLAIAPELSGRGVVVSSGHPAFSLATLLAPFPEGKDMLDRLAFTPVSAADLARLPDGSCPYVLLSHALNEAADPRALLREAKRVLAPDGVLGATLSSIAPPIADETSLFGFSPAAAQYLFQEIFPDRTLTVTSYGNVLAGRALLCSEPANTIPLAKLDFVDPYFPVLTGVLVKR